MNIVVEIYCANLLYTEKKMTFEDCDYFTKAFFVCDM